MACRVNKLWRESPKAAACHFRRGAVSKDSASVFPALGIDLLTSAPAGTPSGLVWLSGSQHTDARLNDLTHVESCPREIQALP
jgi:hypothetical protein